MMRRTQILVWAIAASTMVLTLKGAIAQLPAPLPGDYGIRFGDVNEYFNGHILDISDLHYLGVNARGNAEFLAVFVHGNYPDPIPDDPKYDPIQVVYFEYGGVPLRLTIKNVLTFRPRVSDSNTPSYPGRARLVYQPAKRDDNPRLHPDKWFLVANDGFLFVLPDGFYRMSPAELAPRVSGKYLSYSDSGELHYTKPVFGDLWAPKTMPLPVGVAREPEYGRISSMLILGQGNFEYNNPRIVALNADGGVIGAWEIGVGFSCEEPPCSPPCAVGTDPRFRIGVVGGGGGAANMGIFAPLPANSGTDEYAILLATENRYDGGRTDAAALLMRFGLDGGVRWARMYRHLDSSGSYIDVSYSGAFFVAVDESNQAGLRLLFSWGYQPNFLVYVDAENGNPLWAYQFLWATDTYGHFRDSNGHTKWFLGPIISLDDSEILSVELPAYCLPFDSPQCWDYGDRAFIHTVMGDYLVFADDQNRAMGDSGDSCDSGDSDSGFVPVIKLWDWTRQILVPATPWWDPVSTCVTDTRRLPLYTYIQSVRDRIVERPATLEVRSFEYPTTVECKMDPCEGHICPNGVGWSQGDVAPYNISTTPYLLGDCCVDDDDLLQVLFNFGNEYDYPTQFKPGAGDVNCDEIVDDDDLLIVLFNFGEGCGE